MENEEKYFEFKQLGLKKQKDTPTASYLTQLNPENDGLYLESVR